MLFQRKIDGAMKKLHESSDAAEEERRKDAGEPYEELERPELEKGDMLAMIIAAFITFIPVAILVLGIILVAGYFLLHWQETTGADKDYCVKTRREFEGGEKIAIWG